jgi:hypothetical protein
MRNQDEMFFVRKVFELNCSEIYVCKILKRVLEGEWVVGLTFDPVKMVLSPVICDRIKWSFTALYAFHLNMCLPSA